MGFDLHLYKVNKKDYKKATNGLTEKQIREDLYEYIYDLNMTMLFTESKDCFSKYFSSKGIICGNDEWVEISKEMIDEIKEYLVKLTILDFIEKDNPYGLVIAYSMYKALEEANIDWDNEIVLYEHSW